MPFLPPFPGPLFGIIKEEGKEFEVTYDTIRVIGILCGTSSDGKTVACGGPGMQNKITEFLGTASATTTTTTTTTTAPTTSTTTKSTTTTTKKTTTTAGHHGVSL